MVKNRKLIIGGILLAMTTISVAAIDPPKSSIDPSKTAIGRLKPKNDFSNLKVLPKDISTKNLQRIMVDEFQDGLGVSCNYCHARESGSIHLDYASDEKPEKEIARSMMTMTMDINKKYFGVEHPLIGDSLMTITCSNCHHGTAHPEKSD